MTSRNKLFVAKVYYKKDHQRVQEVMAAANYI